MSTVTAEVKNLVGQTHNGYQLVELLGSGSFGSVYRGKSAHGEVAVKVSINKEMARDEARNLSVLHGTDNVPEVFWSGEVSGFHVIVMTLGFLDLDALRSRNIDSNRAFCHSNIQKILYQTVNILQAIHSKGIVHRDIKSDNIMITFPKGSDYKVEVLLGDFGLSCRYGNEDESGEPRQLGALVHSSASVQGGAQNMPMDDLVQLTYVSIALNSATMSGLFLSPDDRLEYKKGLLTNPPFYLTRKVDWLLPFFAKVGTQNRTLPMDYDGIRESIQHCLPDSNPAAALHLTHKSGVLVLS